MKKNLFTALTFLSLSATSFATVHTVDNKPNSPAQFTNAQTAHDAAAAGDTLYVSGSITSYGTLNITKKLTVVGDGYRSLNTKPRTYFDAITIKNQSAIINASGSKLFGVYMNAFGVDARITGGNINNQVLENVRIENCYLGGNSYAVFKYNSNDHIVRNFDFINCFISCQLLLSSTYYAGGYYTVENFNFLNCIFDSYGRIYAGYTNSNSYSDLSTTTVDHCLFLNTGYNYTSFSSSTTSPYLDGSSVYGLVIKNSIFHSHTPQGGFGCTYINNITYNNLNDTIPNLAAYATTTNNLGSGNMVNVDPQFVNFPSNGNVGPNIYDYDYRLKATSAGKNAATDGTDIGIYGGTYPFDNESTRPRFPFIEKVTIPVSSVPLNGTLNVNIKAQNKK